MGVVPDWLTVISRKKPPPLIVIIVLRPETLVLDKAVKVIDPLPDPEIEFALSQIAFSDSVQFTLLDSVILKFPPDVL